MATKKKADKPDPVVEAVAPVTPIQGYRRAPQYEWVPYWGAEPPTLSAEQRIAMGQALRLIDLAEVQTALVEALPEGTPMPLLARIKTNLSFREVDAIPYGLKVKFEVVWPSIAGYVVDWNLPGENAETGEMELVPPPATAGVEVFKCLSDDEALWLILAIKFKHRQKVESDDAKKDLPTSKPTDSP